MNAGVNTRTCITCIPAGHRVSRSTFLYLLARRPRHSGLNIMCLLAQSVADFYPAWSRSVWVVATPTPAWFVPTDTNWSERERERERETETERQRQRDMSTTEGPLKTTGRKKTEL